MHFFPMSCRLLTLVVDNPGGAAAGWCNCTAETRWFDWWELRQQVARYIFAPWLPVIRSSDDQTNTARNQVTRVTSPWWKNYYAYHSSLRDSQECFWLTSHQTSFHCLGVQVGEDQYWNADVALHGDAGGLYSNYVSHTVSMFLPTDDFCLKVMRCNAYLWFRMILIGIALNPFESQSHHDGFWGNWIFWLYKIVNIRWLSSGGQVGSLVVIHKSATLVKYKPLRTFHRFMALTSLDRLVEYLKLKCLYIFVWYLAFSKVMVHQLFPQWLDSQECFVEHRGCETSVCTGIVDRKCDPVAICQKAVDNVKGRESNTMGFECDLLGYTEGSIYIYIYICLYNIYIYI